MKCFGSIDPKKYLNLILFTTHENEKNTFLITNREIFWTIIYLIFISLISYWAGYLARATITKYKLDKLLPWLRFDNYWYYFFKAYDFLDSEPDMVEIVASIEMSGKTYLYKGILKDFILDNQGKLDRLIITGASRRNIKHDKSDIFYKIEGHYFILKYSEIINLNIFFISLDN
jgi:hypothetical protein